LTVLWFFYEPVDQLVLNLNRYHICDLSLRHLIHLVDIIGVLMCFQSLFFSFCFCEERERKFFLMISEAYQISNNDITNIVEKISRIWIQWHQEMLSTVTRVCHTSRLKANEPLHIWTVRVSHSDHHWWFFYVVRFISSRSFQ
jgi:hypothetical protein